jgi:hypothetical protein
MPIASIFICDKIGDGGVLTFEESFFYINGQKKYVISATSSLDAIEIAKQDFSAIDKDFHFRIFANRARWILDVEGTLDVLRHSKIMGVNHVSIALPLCVGAVLLADQMGCDCIELQCAVAGIEEGIQRPEMIEYIVKNTTTPLVLWGVNEFEPCIVHPNVQYERQFFSEHVVHNTIT